MLQFRARGEEIGLTRKKSNSREIRLLGGGRYGGSQISGLSVPFVFNLFSRLLKFLLATRLFLFVFPRISVEVSHIFPSVDV